MNELTFNELIERIEIKLSHCDDDEVAYFYNQIFDENQIIAIGDGIWEEEITEEFLD